jgi:hypothetical protein
MNCLEEILKNKLNQSENQAFYWAKMNKKRKKSWDVLVSPQEWMLCVLGIRSDDNKTDHAICIVGTWIFDSNFEKALPLSKESLDLCSSSSDCYTGFTGVTRGYVLKSRLAEKK